MSVGQRLPALDWEVDGADWPQREASRFVSVDGLRWHVQVYGEGPVCLLVHGTGASGHTWHRLGPLLQSRFRLVAMDLPGHAFSAPLVRGPRMLPRMACALAALLRDLDVAPSLAVGHSAGAAIIAQMTLDGQIRPHGIVAINGVLAPPSWMAVGFMSMMAGALAATPWSARLLARAARDPHAVSRVVAGTGSRLDARALDWYSRLVRNPAHVDGVLAMMAGWDLRPLVDSLGRLPVPCDLLVADDDLAVPRGEADAIRARLPKALVEHLPRGGHLVHETLPAEVAARILAFAERLGVIERDIVPDKTGGQA
jgi:magnesium chelatase accessory protein